MSKLILLYNTIRELKISQLFWQVIYRVKSKTSIKDREEASLINNDLKISVFPGDECKFLGSHKFCFLNKVKKFDGNIDWNFLEYGKLWCYNLEYFDFLRQDDISSEQKNEIINDFYNFSLKNQRILEPYPISLRAINIIKFIISDRQKNERILNFLEQELSFLHKNYEIHLLGNHLLENAFSLFLAGVFFNKSKWHSKAKSILKKELDEQVLSDGAHFELSVMYHKIIFFRLLELIEWYGQYEDRDDSFYDFCRNKAIIMRSWLENIRFSDGSIPLFNDAAEKIAYDSNVLINYADKLGVESIELSLGISGYRSFINNRYEIKVDFAEIGASYQPGHSHSDALSFILYENGSPLFTEQGTSTYQIGERRNLERSTQAHNTVEVNGCNQSQVWGGFRVGSRARIKIINDSDSMLEASHDGYKSIGVIHKRKFIFNSNIVEIEDEITGENLSGKAYFHLFPGYEPRVDGNKVRISESIICVFKHALEIQIEPYLYSQEFNNFKNAKRIVVSFNKVTKCSILFN